MSIDDLVTTCGGSAGELSRGAFGAGGRRCGFGVDAGRRGGSARLAFSGI